MAHGDSLPEKSTTALERAQWDYDRAVLSRDQVAAAQWDYDRAVLSRDQAAAVVRDKDQAIAAARAKLDQAKREANKPKKKAAK